MPSRSEARSQCPVCDNANIQTRLIESALSYSEGPGLDEQTHCDDAIHFSCTACGQFVVTLCDCVNLVSTRRKGKWNSFQASALLREQTIAKLPPFWLRHGMDPYGPLKWLSSLAVVNLPELLQRWPKSIPERIDRTLCNIGRLSSHAGQHVPMGDEDFALAFAEIVAETIFVRRALIDEGFLDHLLPEGRTTRLDVRLTPKG